MKKFLSLLLGVCLIIPCAFIMSACKKEDPKPQMETWDGSTLEVSAAVDDLITIDTAEELAGFAKSVNEGNSYAGKTIKLACDMDMANKAWTPIGIGNRGAIANAKPFKGTFDGNGKKLINLTNNGYVPTYKAAEADIGGIETYHYGLFGFTEDATITNLKVTVNFDCDADTLKGDSVGGIVGFSSGALTVYNCEVNGTIKGGYDSTGGVVGRAYNTTTEKKVLIKNCVNNANVSADYKVAGILGYTYSAISLQTTVDSCVNNGTIESYGSLTTHNTASRFASIVSGIVVYGWRTNYVAEMNITNNTNNGTLKVNLENVIGRDNLHHYAYVGTRVSQDFNPEKHNYNFEGNSNNANIYYGSNLVADAKIVINSQASPPYGGLTSEFNGKTHKAIETWDGNTKTVSAAVDGVITIDTAEELAGFAKSVNEGNTYAGKIIKLACDMDMANLAWTPIGVGSRKALATAGKFSGIFDGNNKKIINISNSEYTPSNDNIRDEGDVSGLKTYQYGFFGIVVDATIKNIEITVNFDCDDDELKGDSVGGLVGFSSGALTVENCIVNGSINGGYDAVGGIVGRAYNSSTTSPVVIENCINNANVTALYKASGILGYASSEALNLKINNCVNNGRINSIGININVEQPSNIAKRFASMAAGICLYGWNVKSSNKIIVTNNTNNGNIFISEERSEEVDRDNHVAFAYIAAQLNVYADFDKNLLQELHSYDFRGNENTGNIINKLTNELALNAYVDNIFADEYSADKECNGTYHNVED